MPARRRTGRPRVSRRRRRANGVPLRREGRCGCWGVPAVRVRGGGGDADARRHEGHDEIKLAAAQALIELQPALAADGLDAVVEQETLLEADEGVVCQFIHFEAFAIGEGMIRGHDDHERFVPDLKP